MRPESRESGRNRPSNRPCKPEIVAIRNRVHQLTLRRVLCRSSLEELVGVVGGSMSLGEGTHARVLVYDDVVVVSSYNFLSTTQDKRQIGVMLQSKATADTLWDAFEVAKMHSGDGSSFSRLATLSAS